MQLKLLNLVGAMIAFSTATGCPGEFGGKARGESAESAPEETSCTPAEEIPYDDIDQDCDGADLVDVDGDGYVPWWVRDDENSDCDDADAAVYPEAVEACNGVDDDCDGVVPEEERDDDLDGSPACADCDDDEPRASEGSLEVCDDGIDNDCDGVVDEDCGPGACTVEVPGDYPTIQEAIDAASTGDTICVGAGTYVENLNFGGAELSLIGVSGPEATVLDAGYDGSVVVFASGEGAATLLQGFTLTHAWYAPGIYISGSSPTLVDLVVTDNVTCESYDSGAGMYVENGSPTLVNVEISENSTLPCGSSHVWGEGGGVALVGSDVLFDNVVIRSNAAGYDGGGLFMEETTAVMFHMDISDNQSSTVGGGISARHGSISITNGTLRGNASVRNFSSEASAGGMFAYDATVSLTNVIVTGNEAEEDCGGLYLSGGTATLSNVVLYANTAESGEGGGLCARDGTSVSYTDAWGNDPDDYYGISDPTGADGNVSVDPQFLDETWHLADTSPLIDAGDPAILDPDGTTSDIGALGGPDADDWDLDGDGSPSWWLPGAYDATTSPGADCDDEDSDVYPGSGC